VLNSYSRRLDFVGFIQNREVSLRAKVIQYSDYAMG